MKRLSLAIIFACFVLSVSAQDGIRVRFQGSQPTIKDFVTAYLAAATSHDDDEEECEGESFYLYESMKEAMKRQAQGLPLEEDQTLTIDQRNGYLVYKEKHDENISMIEMCYWNEGDAKHKLFAVNRWSFSDGIPSMGQYDDFLFYRYDNATKRMSNIDVPGFDVEYHNTAYALPRTGKDIIVSKWDDNGRKTQTTLKWNGHGFSR